MTIAIKVEERSNDPRYIKYMDFSLMIDGVTDNTLYRMEKGADGFKKLYSVNKKFAYTVRGAKRKIAQELVDNIFNTNINYAMAIVN